MDSKEGIEALFLFATEGILVVNDRGEIIRINPSAEKLFGYLPNELLGKRIEILVPNRYASKHEDYRDKYRNQPMARSMGAGMDLFAQKKDGTEFPVEISLSPYLSADEKYTIAFIVDTSLRKTAEDKLKNYSAELEKQVKNRTLILEEAINELEKTKGELFKALEKERELNELKSRFVSMASHEFRTPLATIQSSLSLVKKYGELQEKEKQGKHFNRIKSSIRDLTEILNDFLSVSKLEEGKVDLYNELMNLPTFCEQIISELQTLCKDGQTIQYKHRGNMEVKSDEKLLKKILLNLLSNAIKFSPSDKEIVVETSASNKEFMLKVSDSGMGIPEKDQQHLFERFFRGQNVTHIQGTGLGLNIVAKYTELMNGDLSFESHENKGTTFTLNFPQ